MWVAPKDNGFRPRFHRKFAYGWSNHEKVMQFQMMSHPEKLEYEKKLIEDNPDLYEQFKFWCRHNGYLKDFYKYDDPVYVLFEGEEWEEISRKSKKIKDTNERVRFIIHNYSQFKPFINVWEEKEMNNTSIKDLCELIKIPFKFTERLLNLSFDGPFEFKDIFLRNIYNNSDKKNISFLFKKINDEDILYIIPNSKNETLRYVHPDGFSVYNSEGYIVEREYKYDF